MTLLYNAITQNVTFSINRLFNSSISFWTHYDILKVPRNCSAKEIRDSFIKLSKENHPDLNRNKDAHKKFLEINQAYKVLSNSQNRHMYDLGLVPSNGSGKPNCSTIYYDRQYEDPWKDPTFYRNRDKTQDRHNENMSYYGIKGVKKVSNSTIALICVSLAAIGVGLQVLAISKSFTFRRDEMIKKSIEAEDSLHRLKNVAIKNGNERQLELLKQRFGDKIKKD